MHLSTAARLALAGFAACLASAGAAQIPHTDIPEVEAIDGDVDVIEGKADRDQRMTIPVAVEGSGPYDFLIDTGSQRTVLSRDLAGRLALDEGPVVKIVGVAGTAEQVPTAYVDQLELGSRELFGTHAPLFEARNIGADGIIGTDSLQDQRVLIDFGRNRMEVGNKKELGGNKGYEIVVTARQLSGQLVMTRAEIDGVKVAVIIDTGATYSVGNRALQRALSRRGARQEVTLHSVTGHQVTAQIGIAKKLKLRRVNLENVAIAFADSPAFASLDLADKPALFLGMRELRVFDRVAIDFSRRQVLFDVPRT